MMKGSAAYSTKKWGSLLVVEGLFEVYRQMSGIVTWMDGWMDVFLAFRPWEPCCTEDVSGVRATVPPDQRGQKGSRCTEEP